MRIRDPVLLYPLDPGSGSGVNFSGSLIPDLFDHDLDKNFAPEGIRSKKKVSLHSTFHVGSGMKNCLDPDPGLENCRIWIRVWDKTSRISNTMYYNIMLLTW
jgi:hypothetical protein